MSFVRVFFFLPAFLAFLAAVSTYLKCLGKGKNVCELLYGWCHTLENPQVCSPWTKLFEFQSNNTEFHDIPCLTIHSVFIGQFHNSILDSMIAQGLGDLQQTVLLMVSPVGNVFFQPASQIPCSLLTTVIPWGEPVSFLCFCVFFPWHGLARKHTFLSSTSSSFLTAVRSHTKFTKDGQN